MAGEPMNLGKMIMLFIGILIGVILISALADPIFETRNAYSQDNNTIDISANKATNGSMTDGSTITLADDNLISLSSGKLGNGTVLTEGSDFSIVLKTGVVTFIANELWESVAEYEDPSGLRNQSSAVNNTEWVYNHGENFVQDSTSRVFLGLILIFFAIGILTFIIAKLTDVFDFIGGS